jgi:hypothetical protein
LFKNNVEDEADFCEAYKSQILNNGASGEKSSFNTFSKILTILLLLIIIVAVSVYGYKYITNTTEFDTPPPSSIQIDDDELIVTEEDEEMPVPAMPPKVETTTLKSIPQIEELDIDKMANDVKLAIAKSEEDAVKKIEKIVKEEALKIPTGDIQSAYLEELAVLSEEIDKESK